MFRYQTVIEGAKLKFNEKRIDIVRHNRRNLWEFVGQKGDNINA